MSEGDWRKLALAGVAALALSLLVIVGSVLWAHSERGRERTDAGATGRNYAQAEQDCLAMGLRGSPAITDCIIQQGAAQYQKKHDQADLHAQQDVAAWTAGLFWVGIFGCVTGVVGIVLLIENLTMLQRQIDDERRGATEQRRQFEAQLGKMEDANRDARESAERQLRAYIGFESMHMMELRNHSRHFQIQWKNSGQSPTKRLQTKWGWWCKPELPPKDFDFPDQHPNESAAAGGIGNAGAGQSFLSNGPILTSEQFNAVIRRELKVLYWAWVDYNDVFPHTPRRRTEACYRLVLVPTEGQIQAGWIAYGRFNGTDEECMKEPKTTGNEDTQARLSSEESRDERPDGETEPDKP